MEKQLYEWISKIENFTEIFGLHSSEHMSLIRKYVIRFRTSVEMWRELY
jgi:hypothetical protein